MMAQTAPDRTTSEEERFESDYFSYLEQPENANRYKPAAYFLNDAFKQKPFSVLDLGCGNGAINQYLPDWCDYLGVDHSERAIAHCRTLYPGKQFVCKDLSLFLSEAAEQKQKFDAIILCGILFHATDKESLEQKDNEAMVKFCLNNILKPDGYLAIIVPFAYGDRPEHNLFARGKWIQTLVEEMLQRIGGKAVHENLCLLLGLEEKIRQQKQIPDWFFSDSMTDYPNEYAGTYMAAWTIMASPQLA